MCNLCFSKQIKTKTYTYNGINTTQFKIRNLTLPFLVCEDCGYSYCLENDNDYSKLTRMSATEQTKTEGGLPRVGDGITPGREFLMALDAIKILNREKLRVLIFGPGMSKDHELLRKHPLISECIITDLKNFQESEYFIPLQSKKVFDIIIICEVAEHFIQPRKEFSNIFSLLSKNSLLVVSTNMRWVDNFSKNLYPFLSGHTSYYSPKSLIYLADMNNFYIDFRTPKSVSTGDYFKGKNYIYLTNNKIIHFNTLSHFSKIIHPLSE